MILSRHRLSQILFCLIGICSTLFFSSSIFAADSNGVWKELKGLETGQSNIGIELTGDKILIAGGYDGNILRSTFTYDFSENNWSSSGLLNIGRMILTDNGLVKLSNGQIIIVNGEGPNYIQGTNSVEKFNPNNNNWTQLSSSRIGRYRAIVAKLPNDKILLASGNIGNNITNTTEIYDYNLNAWTDGPDMATGREGRPNLAYLNDGKIIITGGKTQSSPATNIAEIFNPIENNWRATQMPYSFDDGSSVKLSNGKIMIIGGYDGQNVISNTALYNPITNSWEESAHLPSPRAGHTSFLLSDNKIIVIGGGDNLGNFYLSSEIYDPNTNTWTSGPSLPHGFNNGASILLPNKDIFIVGGYDGQNRIKGAHLFTNPQNNILLNVPLLKQSNSQWKNQTYDSADLWNSSNPTINAWGCALTSATMVLNFYGINKLPDKKPVNPSTLNDWLKMQKDGYVGNGLVNWLALSRLSKLSKNINNITAFDALEFNKINTSDKNIVNVDISNNIPDILQVPGHFIVARGINKQIIQINDPAFNRTDLSYYNNTFSSINRFKPSNTDLSYLMIISELNIDISIKDQNGNKISESFVQEEIINPFNSDQKSNPIKITYAPKPNGKDFEIISSSNKNISSEIEIFLYDKTGNVFSKNEKVNLLEKEEKVLDISFNSNINLYPKKVTYSSISNDIFRLFKKDQIKSLILRLELNNLIIKAKIENALKHKSDSLKTLNEFEDLINKNRGKNITDSGYNVLLYDINYLQTHL